MEANFTNCIIYGNDNPEFIVDNDPSETFNFKLTNCLLRFDSNNFTGPLYDFGNTSLYENVIRNEDPEFLDAVNNKLQIPNGSISDGFAIPFGMLSTDITNTPRGNPADLGAYESIVFPEDD